LTWNLQQQQKWSGEGEIVFEKKVFLPFILDFSSGKKRRLLITLGMLNQGLFDSIWRNPGAQKRRHEEVSRRRWSFWRERKGCRI
jgi:hypothetical protein